MIWGTGVYEIRGKEQETYEQRGHCETAASSSQGVIVCSAATVFVTALSESHNSADAAKAYHEYHSSYWPLATAQRPATAHQHSSPSGFQYRYQRNSTLSCFASLPAARSQLEACPFSSPSPDAESASRSASRADAPAASARRDQHRSPSVASRGTHLYEAYTRLSAETLAGTARLAGLVSQSA